MRVGCSSGLVYMSQFSSVVGGGVGRRVWRKGHRFGRLALVALGEKPEGVDLSDEVGHASPSPEPEPDHKNPPHNEDVNGVHGGPAGHEEWRLLRSILQCQQNQQAKKQAAATHVNQTF